MAEWFLESEGKVIVESLITMIHENRVYLSDIDGAIGDGDHGINMDKGFSLTAQKLAPMDVGLSESFKILGTVLIEDIGGSMGPLYGTFFKRMARATRQVEKINSEVLERMLTSAYEGIQIIGPANVGDKTMVDTLVPAMKALEQARLEGLDFSTCIDKMIEGAYVGWQSTIDLIARVGRASRLGERSRGVLDAGATSCYLILKTIGEKSKELAR